MDIWEIAAIIVDCLPWEEILIGLIRWLIEKETR